MRRETGYSRSPAPRTGERVPGDCGVSARTSWWELYLQRRGKEAAGLVPCVVETSPAVKRLASGRDDQPYPQVLGKSLGNRPRKDPSNRVATSRSGVHVERAHETHLQEPVENPIAREGSPGYREAAPPELYLICSAFSSRIVPSEANRDAPCCQG